EAQLVDSSGTVRDLSFVINNGNTGVFTDTAVAAGYYTLVVKLLDNSIYTMGAVEIVRIVAGETTTGQLEFTEINKPGGNMLLNITADMEEPVEVTLTDIPAELSESSSSAVVTASVPVDVGTVTYAWYLNGELVYTGLTADPEYTIPVSTLTVGNVYRLDAAVFSSDGKRAGSVSDTFTVIVDTPPVFTKLTASDGRAGAIFGRVTAISADGNTVVAGSNIDDTNGFESGCIYIYQWDGLLWNETKITASDGTAGDKFGSSASISADGNTIVTGATMDDENGEYSGSIYVYQWDGSLWSETKIMASNGAESFMLGTDVNVSADGNTIVTGLPLASSTGSVFIYKWNGSIWNETIIKPFDGVNLDLFGAALTVSADGNTVVAGASMDDDNGSNSGSVYIYKWNGSDWVVTKLTASDGMPYDLFGKPVSISGDGTILAVGAPSANSGEGGFYIYRWDGSTWNESKFTPSASNGVNNFGDNLSISADGNTLVVGCQKDDEMSVDSGAIFIYKWNGSLWNETKHMAPDSATEDNFGVSVSLSSDGSTIVAGAHRTDDMGNDSGALYIYR
ncbi:MAG: hypothetical protein GY754_09140, partial [bacterium]|nr:hypothetical protein [bacterium]